MSLDVSVYVYDALCGLKYNVMLWSFYLLSLRAYGLVV